MTRPPLYRRHRRETPPRLAPPRLAAPRLARLLVARLRLARLLVARLRLARLLVAPCLAALGLVTPGLASPATAQTRLERFFDSWVLSCGNRADGDLWCSAAAPAMSAREMADQLPEPLAADPTAPESAAALAAAAEARHQALMETIQQAARLTVFCTRRGGTLGFFYSPGGNVRAFGADTLGVQIDEAAMVVRPARQLDLGTGQPFYTLQANGVEAAEDPANILLQRQAIAAMTRARARIDIALDGEVESFDSRGAAAAINALLFQCNQTSG